VALVFRVLLVAGLQDDRQPEGPAQVDGVPPAPAHNEPPRVGPRAARPGPAPRQRRAVRLPRDDGAPEGRADRRRAAPAPRPRRLAQTRQHGAQGQRRDAQRRSAAAPALPDGGRARSSARGATPSTHRLAAPSECRVYAQERRFAEQRLCRGRTRAALDHHWN